MPHEMGASGSAESVLRWVCGQLDRRLREGTYASAEEYLASYPELASDDDAALELIYTEFVTREELGERPSAAAWCARFPQWRARLQRLLEIHTLLHAGDQRRPRLRVPIPHSGATAPSLPDGRHQLGPYVLLEELGRGGMGVVYKARQMDLNRLVALKVIRTGALACARDREMFLAEARVVARLRHGGVVQIFAVGEEAGWPYFAMEFVVGGNLACRLARRPLSPKEAARLATRLARALAYTHRRGVIHRDLKPANILLTAHGQPKIIDFGLAERVVPRELLPAPHGRVGAAPLAGTPCYMAPEQFAGGERGVGREVDIYALGAVLYEALTGRPPFQGNTLLETLQQVYNDEPIPPRQLRPGIPPELEAICLKCLAKVPAQRFASASELAQTLRRLTWARKPPR